jgi:hypothetical protein
MIRTAGGQSTAGLSAARPVRRGVSKGKEDGRRPSALRAKRPNGHKAVWGVARPQGIYGSGMAGPHETLGSPGVG